VRTKPVIPRALALQDTDEAIDYYLRENAPQAAYGFIDALEQAYLHIGRHPASGSARVAHELEIAGLLGWHLKRYPHVVFYFERVDHIDVLRVLHDSRDVPAWLQGSASG
jgi:toxin ParE1/3/4